MKKEVIVCDRCDREVEKPTVVKEELCSECKDGKPIDLKGLQFRDYPSWLSKATVKEVLQQRDKEGEYTRTQLQDEKAARAELNRELVKLRERAARGLMETNMEAALGDAVSAADRQALR
jgi:hypothetical protein